jgi:hypothetical protein
MTNVRKPDRGIDGLLTPSLSNETDWQTPPGKKPWRQEHQFLVAFFGGSLAYTVIAYINSKRLGLAKDRLLLIVLLGVIALVACFYMSYHFPIAGFHHLHSTNRKIVRFGSRLISVLLYLICSSLQRSADRIYLHRDQDNEPYQSLLVPGLIASIGLQVLQFGFIYGILFLMKSL